MKTDLEKESDPDLTLLAPRLKEEGGQTKNIY